MRHHDDGRTCTTSQGCTSAPEYEITASGFMVGVPYGVPPKPVHLFACGKHLHIAQERARNRTEKHIELLENQQPSLFDNL